MTNDPLRVLLADDHEPTRSDVRRALEADARFRVCAEAADAAGAVEAALRQAPDLCLLDIGMPGGGLSAAWEIRSRLPGTSVVMLTVSEDDEDLLTAIEAGVAGYLLKNTDRRRLPLALWDIHRGTFTMPRTLVGRVVEQLRGSAPAYRSVAGSAGARLTSREWQVLDLLARGLSSREVATRLSVSTSVVRVHAASAVKKLGAASRAEAIAAFRHARSD